MCFAGPACRAGVCPAGSPWGHPSVPEPDALTGARVETPKQAPRPVRSFPSLTPGPPAPGSRGGRHIMSCTPTMCPRADTRVHVQVPCPRGLHGALPSAPGRATQMAQSTRLLPAALRLLFPGPSSKTRGGREGAWEGPPQLLCSPLLGRDQSPRRAVTGRAPALSAPGAPGLSLGREAVSGLRVFAQALPATWSALPARHHC